MSPQMLRGSRMARFLDSIKKSKSVRWMLVDEAHLAADDNDGWRVAYATLKFMRARLFSHTIWAAFTGTATPVEALRIARSLAFNPKSYVNARYSVDIPHIKYTTRFMAHPHSGNDFYDLAFLIPPTMTSPQDIPRTFVFCETIDLGSRVMAFLDSLIPAVVPRHDQIVKTYNSLMPPDYRQDFIKDIVDGSTLRIGVCTDTCTYGLDISCIRRVVIYGLCADFSTMKQRICRVGRDGLPAIAYTIVPEWVREIPEDEITTAQGKEHAARRAKLPTVIRQWHNPTVELCPREVDRRHNEEKPDAPKPDECCSAHKPEPEQNDDLRVIAYWTKKFNPEQPPKKKLRANKDSHRALEPHMIKALTRMLTGWRGATWLQLRGLSRDGLAIQFLPTATLNRIAEKAHICTSLERLEQVLEGYMWSYQDQYGQKLVDFLAQVMDGFDDIFQARKQVESDGESAEPGVSDVQNPPKSDTKDLSQAEKNTANRVTAPAKPRLRLLLPVKRKESGDGEKGDSELSIKRTRNGKENCR